MSEEQKSNFIKWYSEVGIGDVGSVGGKNAALGEMYSNLVPLGVKIPDGFALTANAYRHFFKETGLDEEIKKILADLDTRNIQNLQVRGRKVRETILKAILPQDLKDIIAKSYAELEKKYGKNLDVAVRSSATAEDLPGASFAGQQETYLNIAGPENVLFAVKKCFASLFTDRAIVYREEMKLDHLKVGLSVGVQKMVRSDLGASGVMFSCDTESGFGDVVLINASYGLGENVVQGAVEPDQYYVFETTLKRGFKPIIEKRIGGKLIKMIYGSGKVFTKNINTTKKERENFVLSNEEILNLAKWSV